MASFPNYQDFPSKPGVYLFRDKNGNILYIGKALNLRKRVENYYKKTSGDYRINNLLKKTVKIGTEIVGSEIEALLLEARLIKQYQPKYNVRLKDDKRYLYVGMTKESYPRIFLLRQPEKNETLLDWFGPFPSSQSLKEILRLLRRIFPFRSCRKMPKTVCLYHHLKLCPGMCQHSVGRKRYQADIGKVRLFLDGKINFLLRKLRKEMDESARRLEFEKAQQAKRKIQMIENLLGSFKKMPEEQQIQNQLEWMRKILLKYQKIDPVVIHRLEAYDVANLAKTIVVGTMIVFTDGEPENSEYRQFKVKSRTGGDPSALKEVLQRRLRHKEWLFPQLILVDGGKSQLSEAFEALKNYNLVSQIAIIGLVKEKETLVIPMIKKSKIKGWKLIGRSDRAIGLPIFQYARDEAHRFAQRYYKKLHRKATLPSFGRG